MTEITNIPATLDIKTSISDLSFVLTFTAIDLTGYTFAALVHVADTGTDVSWTVTNTNLAGGIITLSLTDVQIAAIGKGYHSWDIEANSGVASGDRYYISGLFQVV
jgi:hypothetical protein